MSFRARRLQRKGKRLILQGRAEDVEGGGFGKKGTPPAADRSEQKKSSLITGDQLAKVLQNYTGATQTTAGSAEAETFSSKCETSYV